MFDWIVEPEVGACAYPREPGAWESLCAAGIGLVINLHERAHEASVLERYGVEEVHLPVRDFTPPTAEQLERGVELMTQAIQAGRRVMVHCGAGLGRTGTLVACYLVSQGAEPKDAIQRVRAARPGSIETAAQEKAVREFAARRHGS
jgi:atypical dual specificity phosphatase